MHKKQALRRSPKIFVVRKKLRKGPAGKKKNCAHSRKANREPRRGGDRSPRKGNSVQETGKGGYKNYPASVQDVRRAANIKRRGKKEKFSSSSQEDGSGPCRKKKEGNAQESK